MNEIRLIDANVFVQKLTKRMADNLASFDFDYADEDIAILGMLSEMPTLYIDEYRYAVKMAKGVEQK